LRSQRGPDEALAAARASTFDELRIGVDPLAGRRRLIGRPWVESLGR
jgi:hypothetical protein